MVSAHNLTVWLFDATGARRGVVPYTTLTVVKRHLDVGKWLVTAPLSADLASVGEGWRVAITDGDRRVTSGLLDEEGISVGADSASSTARTPARITLSGPDDLQVIADRYAYPDPVNAVTAQAQAYDVRTGVASTVIRDYVRVNASKEAPVTARRTPLFELAPDPVTGISVTGRARFTPLLEVIRGLAEQAGLGFRVWADSAGVRWFEVYAPRDLTGAARFSMGLKNLRGLTYRLSGPSATTIIGGGRGEETARDFIEVTDSAAVTAWRRIEGFYDYRSASDSDGGVELTKGAQQRLAEGAAGRQVSMIPVDTPRLTYGVDYDLGDKITVGVYGNITVPAVIREVEITSTRAGAYRVEPRIGDLGATLTSKQSAALADALARLGNLERR